MKSMRTVCWIWIVASTTVVLFWAPVSVTRDYRSGSHVTSIEWIGPFGEPFRSLSVTKSSIDFSRLIVVLLAANLLPAVILWRSEAIGEWLQRHKRKVIISACVLVILFLLIVGSAMYEQAYRGIKSSRVVSPSPAPVIHPAKTPSGSNFEPGLPPGFVWETTPPAPGATPTPVRRAIPVEQ